MRRTARSAGKEYMPHCVPRRISKWKSSGKHRNTQENARTPKQCDHAGATLCWSNSTGGVPVGESKAGGVHRIRIIFELYKLMDNVHWARPRELSGSGGTATEPFYVRRFECGQEGRRGGSLVDRLRHCAVAVESSWVRCSIFMIVNTTME